MNAYPNDVLPFKTLTLVTARLGHPDFDELIRREAEDTYPRVILFEKSLNAVMLNEKFLERQPTARRYFYRLLPTNLAQVMEASRISRRYDAVICWAENLGIPFALMKILTRNKVPLFGIFSWISRPKKARLLRRIHHHLDRIILMSSRQRDFAVNDLNIPPHKVALYRWPVDQKFWRPLDRKIDMICSVGREMRDYGTLLEAMKGLEIPCHIAAGGITSGKKDPWRSALKNSDSLQSNITVGKKSFTDLRELYARSRFVVIPLLPTETDNGTTSILEAMAMGKSVICSNVLGQRDVVQNNVNGLLVPPQDAGKLREAIMYLWNNPEVAEEMGRQGRKFVEEHHSFDSFVQNVKENVQEIITVRKKEELDRQRNGTRRVNRGRILTVVTPGQGRPPVEELRMLEQTNRHPRTLIYQETLNSDILDENFLRRAPVLRRIIYKMMPALLAQTLEAFIVKKEYEAVITWSGHNGLPFALLLKLTGSHYPHICMMTWISKAKKSLFLSAVHNYIDRIILWSSVQYDFAANALNLPSEKLVLLNRRVDHKFWHPMNVETDMICSAGQEMRDYPTLIDAMKGLEIKCHIATGALRGVLYDTVEAIYEKGPLPPNVTVGKLSMPELRNLYARSRFVVIPLRETDTDNGVTAIEEAMAMGKAVICTRTKGQVDMIQEGKTGLYVPAGNPEALREAILYLWNNPEVAERMGGEGRKFIETHHTIDMFVQKVKQVVDGVIERRTNGRVKVPEMSGERVESAYV